MFKSHLLRHHWTQILIQNLSPIFILKLQNRPTVCAVGRSFCRMGMNPTRFYRTRHEANVGLTGAMLLRGLSFNDTSLMVSFLRGWFHTFFAASHLQPVNKTIVLFDNVERCTLSLFAYLLNQFVDGKISILFLQLTFPYNYHIPSQLAK